MLVLITYDVNTETAAGKKSCKAMCELWNKSTEFCI